MVFQFLLILIGFLALTIRPVHAYLDPGTGSYFVQIIIATLAGGGYLLISSWDKIKKFLDGVFKGKKRDGAKK